MRFSKLIAIVLCLTTKQAIATSFNAQCVAHNGFQREGSCYTLSTAKYNDINQAVTTECIVMDSIGILGHAAAIYNQAQLDALAVWDSRLLATSSDRAWIGFQQSSGAFGAGIGWYLQVDGGREIGPFPDQAVGEPLRLAIWDDTQPNGSADDNYAQIRFGKLVDVENSGATNAFILCEYENPQTTVQYTYSFYNRNLGELIEQDGVIPRPNAQTTLECSIECSALGGACGAYSFNHARQRCRLALIDPTQIGLAVEVVMADEMVTVYTLMTN